MQNRRNFTYIILVLNRERNIIIIIILTTILYLNIDKSLSSVTYAANAGLI
jgi:hypothetical protein